VSRIRYIKDGVPGRAALLGSLLLVALGGAGCDSYREIREGLGEADRARFDRGLRLASPCWTCHDITGDASKVGPPLRGMFGRRAGSLPGYPYSEALSASPVIWSRPTLDRFLADVSGYIVGNRMLSAGIPSPRNRSDLILFLEHATRADPGAR
jgi:cytochrome c